MKHIKDIRALQELNLFDVPEEAESEFATRQIHLKSYDRGWKDCIRARRRCKKQREQTKRKGFALTETLFAIAVVVIIGIAAYPLYKSSRDKSVTMRITNALIELNKTADVNRRILQPQLPSAVNGVPLNADQMLDMTDFMFDNGLLSPELFTKLDFPSKTLGIAGTNWYVQEYASTGGMNINIGQAIGSDNCVTVGQAILPLFDRYLTINGQSIRFNQPGAPADMQKNGGLADIVNACALNTAQVSMNGIKTF